jgi:cell division protein FtsI/penicillin-binding protein 2
VIRRRVAAAAVVVIGASTAMVGCSSTPSPRPVADAYLTAWSKGDLAGAAATTDDPTAATLALTDTGRQLGVQSVRATITTVKTSGSTATATFHATLLLNGFGEWAYDGAVALARSSGKWGITWKPSTIHPQLIEGQHFARTRALYPRADILDNQDHPLFTSQRIVVVTVDPLRFTGGATALHTLATAVGIDEKTLGKRIQAAGTAAVEVIRLRRSDYDRVKSKIYALPGVVFPQVTARLAPTRSFARQLLGSEGPATADALKDAGPGYVSGDTLGSGGLQAAYQKRLAGSARGSIRIVDSGGSTVTTLMTFSGRRGLDISTTLDRRVQQAAEAALDAAHVTVGALVAIRPSDGSILAVANRPTTSSLDRALTGRYPPGSTFKVVTTYDLLDGAVTPSTSVPCPPTITVDGKKFTNFEGETRSSATFADDFALSCNTAFISLAQKRPMNAFADAAEGFGLGTPWTLPVPAFTGSIPAPKSDVEHVAMAIGQARDLVSPLDMAMVAAAVEDGTWRAPTLVTAPTQSPAPGSRKLTSGLVTTLRSLMMRVVTSGTASSAGLPTGTAGKTGTAEFGTGATPTTHAWFIGYRGDIAFAVLVEGGGVGGRVAAPIAARFLRSL